MTKFEKIIAEFLCDKFNKEWKGVLTSTEQQVFYFYYVERYSIIKISSAVHYSDRQVIRILNSARRKIEKIL